MGTKLALDARSLDLEPAGPHVGTATHSGPLPAAGLREGGSNKQSPPRTVRSPRHILGREDFQPGVNRYPPNKTNGAASIWLMTADAIAVASEGA